MEAYKKTVAALTEHNRVRIAAMPPPPPDPSGGGGLPGAPPGMGGGSPFSDNAKRTIPQDFKFDPHSLKPLVQTLWAMSVALGHALTAHRQFARLKSSTISPDGMLGGRGYVMGVKDIRQRLFESCEHLSAIVDTIHDEVNAPHWKPKLGELEKGEIDDLKKLLSEAEENLEDPEGDATEEMEGIEQGGKTHSWDPAGKERFDHQQDASAVPQGGDAETIQRGGPHPANPDNKGNKTPGNRPVKQASSNQTAMTEEAVRSLIDEIGRNGLVLEYGNYDRRTANSSVDPGTLPGPRVEHLDRADEDQQGPFGAVNDEPPPMHDPWSRGPGAGVLRQNDYTPNRQGESGIPDSNSDDTPTEGFDFGIGRGGGNDAHGQGAGGYGESNPSSGAYGVYGPASGLPHDPGGKTHDNKSDSTPTIEVETGGGSSGMTEVHASLLPNDEDPPVARSDYYRGPKGNDVDVPIASGSGLPNDGAPGTSEGDLDMSPNKSERTEQSAPYTLWDDTTHEQRPDYTYMRGPFSAPYTKQG